MDPMARDVGHNDVGAMLQQEVKIYNVFAMCTTLFAFVVYSGSKWRTGLVVKCNSSCN